MKPPIDFEFSSIDDYLNDTKYGCSPDSRYALLADQIDSKDQLYKLLVDNYQVLINEDDTKINWLTTSLYHVIIDTINKDGEITINTVSCSMMFYALHSLRSSIPTTQRSTVRSFEKNFGLIYQVTFKKTDKYVPGKWSALF